MLDKIKMYNYYPTHSLIEQIFVQLLIWRLQNENWDTDGHLGKIFYTNYNTKYRFKNRDLWKFEAHRDFKRTVAKEYPKNWTMYLQIENKSNLSYLYLKETEEHLEEIKTYNEFEF